MRQTDDAATTAAGHRRAADGRRCWMARRRAWGFGVAALLAGSVAGTVTTSGVEQPPQDPAAVRADNARAAQLARAGGFELLHAQPCPDAADGCLRLAVRQPDGEALVYEVSARRCSGADEACLDGDVVTSRIGGRRAGTGPRRKISGKPGKDGMPSDPQHDAQAAATNEILEALADGRYEGEYDQFWADLDSIRDWDMPSWREPDGAPPTEDRIRTTGAFGQVSPGVLLSGRSKNAVTGQNQCRSWTSFTSTSSPIDNIGNWIGNLPFDGCASEVAVFSRDGAAQLIKPERRWSDGADDLDYVLGGRVSVPTSVWVIYAPAGYAAEQAKLESEFERANSILAESRCGIEIGPVTYHDRTAALDDPEVRLGCASIDSTFKPLGFHANRMNVYIVNQLIAGPRAGVACRAESDNVIVLDRGRRPTALIHEYGHWFDLWHTDTMSMPLVNPQNIMVPGGSQTMLTAGQCYRANFSARSYINMRGLRSGPTRNCRHRQDADDQCPGLKNEF